VVTVVIQIVHEIVDFVIETARSLVNSAGFAIFTPGYDHVFIKLKAINLIKELVLFKDFLVHKEIELLRSTIISLLPGIEAGNTVSHFWSNAVSTTTVTGLTGENL